MASNAELDARLQIIEGIISGAIVIPEGSLKVTDSNVVIGSHVWGIKAGINNGKFFQGYVQGAAPPTSDAHIDFTYKLT